MIQPSLSDVSPHLPADPPVTGIRWWRWIALWLCFLAAETALLANNAHLDTLAWNATRWFVGDREGYNWAAHQQAHAGDAAAHFYNTQTPPLHSRFYKHTQHLWEVLRSFGEPWMTAIIVMLVGLYHPRKWAAAGLVAGIILLAGGSGALIRCIDGRVRPTHTDGANHWELMRGFSDHSSDLAFPSGHATLAFATAAVFAFLSKRGRWLFVAVAVGCAVSRVVMGAHFWGDALFGAVWGWSVAWWMTRALGKILSVETAPRPGVS